MKKGPLRLTSIVRAHSASSSSPSGMRVAKNAALFTSTSIPPKSASMAATALRAASGSDTSHCVPTAVPPVEAIMRAVSCAVSRSMSHD